jgi:hypothetical protein
VTTRSFDLPDLTPILVGHLAEAAELLAKYVPASAQRPRLVDQIIEEAAGMAVLIAAVGARLQKGSVADLERYVQWLSTFKVDSSTDLEWDNYPPKFGAIVYDLYARLHPASVRALEYAALFPPDQINPEDLGAVLVADQSAPDLGWEEQIPGVVASIDAYLGPLREREIMTGPESGPWSLHRLHRRALTERLNDQALAARADGLGVQAATRSYQAHHDAKLSHHTSAFTNYGHAIAILMGIREALSARGEWCTSLENDLAETYIQK